MSALRGPGSATSQTIDVRPKRSMSRAVAGLASPTCRRRSSTRTLVHSPCVSRPFTAIADLRSSRTEVGCAPRRLRSKRESSGCIADRFEVGERGGRGAIVRLGRPPRLSPVRSPCYPNRASFAEIRAHASTRCPPIRSSAVFIGWAMLRSQIGAMQIT